MSSYFYYHAIIQCSKNNRNCIEKQTLFSQIEILVIDGGSTDSTIEIAREHGAVVIHNPHRLPEPAKLLGLKHAKGMYVVFQDTDEEYASSDQLERRINLFRLHPEIKLIVCDHMYAGKDGVLSAPYTCLYGDPFTYFVYRSQKGVFDTFQKNVSFQASEGAILHFSPDDIVPIGDSGTTMFDLEWAKAAFADEWNTLGFVCAKTEKICRKTQCCGILPADDVIHHVQAPLKVYLSKLRFRIINNLFNKEESGYSARVKSSAGKKMIRRKYLFVLYVATIVGPLFDSVKLSVQNRDASLLLHAFYVWYVCGYIGWCIVKKCIGAKKFNNAYAASTFYRWKHALRDQLLEQMESPVPCGIHFVRLPQEERISSPGQICIRGDNAVLEVPADLSEEALCRILRAVKHAW